MAQTKYIFVTGGVVSSLGKGLAAASIGALLEGHEVLRAEGTLQRGRLGEPGIVESRRIPEVHVRVHHARAGHG